MSPLFDLQGHRGARGLRPENTLPAFEAALDLLVTTVETDLHLTADGVPVLSHDAAVTKKLARVRRHAACPSPLSCPLVSSLTLAQLRHYVVDRKQANFPEQANDVTPLAAAFAAKHGLHAYGIPALSDLFDFVAAYAGELGRAAGKTAVQRERARAVRFNLELKRVPFHPEFIGDQFDGAEPGRLELAVLAAIRQHGLVKRVTVQSFDHRSVKVARQLEPSLDTAVLIADTSPWNAAAVVRAADATVYAPCYEFLDAEQVRQVQAAGFRVVPWTVNNPADMERLLDWGVNGLITDYPDRAIPLLRACKKLY